MSRRPFLPVKVLDIDDAGPLDDVSMTDPTTGTRYGGVFCLVRREGRPLSVVEFAFEDRILPAGELRARIAATVAADDPAQRSVPAGRQPFASVVVATRDRPESLARCIDSLLAQADDGFDMVVVDNAPSSSATADLVAGRYGANARVRYVCEDRPGLGSAHNAGIARVSAPLVLFTDDDVVADPAWVGAMKAGFGVTAGVGCVTGLILPAEIETRAQLWTERHGGFGKGFERKVYDLGVNRPAGPLFPFTAGQFGSGANMAFSMEALRGIGGFDPALGAGTLARGGDDLASFYAVVTAGFRLVYEPGAVVWHHHRRAEEGMRRQAFGYGMGLGAYLTKLVVDEPATALRLAKALPAGLAHMMGPSSLKNRRLPDDYPAALVWRERFGVLAGIPAYLRSRAAARRSMRPSGKAHAGGKVATGLEDYP